MSRREWSQSGADRKEEEEEEGGCADLIGPSSWQEPSNGRKWASSSCRVGGEDAQLFCKSVNRVHESHSVPGLCCALRRGPWRSGFSSSSSLPPAPAPEDYFGGGMSSPSHQALGQELTAEWENLSVYSPRAALCLSKVMPLRRLGRNLALCSGPCSACPGVGPSGKLLGYIVALRWLEF